MKVTDALWEKRNINAVTLEIEIEDNDDISLIDTEYQNYEYIVAKVPTRRIDILHKLEDGGFRFIESQMELIKSAKDEVKSLNYLTRLSQRVKFKKVEDNESLSIVTSNITPEMFTTDRISLDPHFGTTIGAERMKNWILDEYEKTGSELYALEYKNEVIGFVLLKTNDSPKMSVILGGMFTKYKGSGLGFTIIEKPISIAIDRNFDTIVTKVSSNNLSVIKLYSLFNFTVNNIHYVLVKHNSIK